MEDKELSGNIDIGEKTTPMNKGLMSIQLTSIKYREWFQTRRDSVQPWAQFLNTAKFKSPKTVADVGQRVVKNVDKFQSNYLFVFMGLVVFCVLTSPLLLIAMAASLGACYIVNLKNAERPLTVMGKELAIAHQYAGIAVMSFPLFWLAGAGGAIFWLIGASVFVIMLHATLHDPSDPAEQFPELPELKMETV